MVRKKGFYSISAVAKMFTIHQQTIRLYEKEGLITPKRSDGNTRLFSDEDIDRLEEIIYLTHQLGVNLAGVQMILKLEDKISKMQKKMNAMFEKTSQELKEEKEIAKSSILSSARALMQLKNEAGINSSFETSYTQEDPSENDKNIKQKSKTEKNTKAKEAHKDLNPEINNVYKKENRDENKEEKLEKNKKILNNEAKKQQKIFDQEIDNWKIEYDDD